MTKITNTYVLDKAKISVLLLIMLFTCPLAFAQSEPETAKPLTDMEVVRKVAFLDIEGKYYDCLLYTSPSPRDLSTSRMPSSA